MSVSNFMAKLVTIKVRIFLLSMGLVPFIVSAQDSFDIRSASMYYPHRFQPKEWTIEVAYSQVNLPFDWLQTAIQAPLFHFHVNYGLPKGFSLDSRFSSLFISNQWSLGTRWNYQLNKFSFNVGYDLAFTWGYFYQLGFATSVTSWINYPNASVGFRVKDIAFTLKGEYMVVMALSSKQGHNEMTVEDTFANGGSLGIYMEQRVHNDKVLVLGIRNSYVKHNFMAWPAFSTFNRHYNIPEFYVGLIL